MCYTLGMDNTYKLITIDGKRYKVVKQGKRLHLYLERKEYESIGTYESIDMAKIFLGAK